MSEEFAFRQSDADCPTVSSDKWSLAALAIEPMQRVGNQLLAGTSFTINQNRKVTQGTNSSHPAKDGKHLRTLSNDTEVSHLFLDPSLFVISLRLTLPGFGQRSLQVAAIILRTAVEQQERAVK